MSEMQIDEETIKKSYQRVKYKKNKQDVSICCEKWRNDYSNFKRWYTTEFQKQQGVCEYCGLPGDTMEAYGRHFRDGKRGLSLEVERKIAKRNYSPRNCVLACYPCNNAKSDVFTYDEFKKIGQTIREIKNRKLLK